MRQAVNTQAGINAPQFQHCSKGPLITSWQPGQAQCRCRGWRSS